MDNYEEIEEKNRKRLERKEMKKGDKPRDCFDVCTRDFEDEQMDYDFYMSDGENNDRR